MTTRKYGWKKQAPDSRDLKFVPPMSVALPSSVDLRPNCPPVYNQADLGSCTANAIGGLVEYTVMKLKHFNYMPSRLFVYYNERALEGTINEDAGAIIRDGMKVVHQYGVPREDLWPYNTAVFTHKPSDAAYKNGLQHLVTKYEAVTQDENHIKACLAGGSPVVFGFTVYESFESEAVAKTGKMPMPHVAERVLGGHAVCMVGYDDAMQCFIVRNSWGAGWGDKGYFYMPYIFAIHPNLASDFWTASFVTNH